MTVAMIKFDTGNILDSPAQCLVNTVNCEGYMGKGIAYQFKERYPLNNKIYAKECKSGKFSVGHVLFFDEGGKTIANFPTKDKWREKSQYKYIESGLVSLKSGVEERAISSVAIPPLGCGNGGLDWSRVKQMITDSLRDISADVIIYEPSKHFVSASTKASKMSASHLILMQLKRCLDPSHFGKLRLQKTAYFLNVFSGTDYFKFKEHKFGPYAYSIEILSEQIKDFERRNSVTTDEAYDILYRNQISDSVKATVEKYRCPIQKASSFVNSIDTNHELEIAATIVAIVRTHLHCTDEQIIDHFFEWPKEDKTRFTRDEIEVSIKRLVKSLIITPELLGYTVSSSQFLENNLTPKYITTL